MRIYLWILGLLLMFTSCKEKPVNLHRIEGKQIGINSEITPDTAMVNMVAPFKEKLEKDMNEVLAYSPTNLVRNREMVETNIGNFMADLCYKQGNAVFTKNTGKSIDFVLLNIGGVRAEISKGNVTTRNAFEVMPFENSMVVAELHYDKIIELLEYLAKSGPHPFSKQLKLVFENDEIVSAKINDKDFSEGQTYFVLTSDYLQHGGDRMNFFKNPISLVDLDYKIRTAIIDELVEIDTISAKVDGRLIRKN